MFQVSKVLVALAMCVATFAFASADAPSFIEVEGPNNNIMSGRPLFVPQIIDIFADDKLPSPEEIYSQIKETFLNQPPSAALAEKIQAAPVDVLEMLDIAEKQLKERKMRAAKKAAKKARAKLAGKMAVKKLNALASRQQASALAITKEVERIDDLMAKAARLQSELPKKRARLEVLKAKLAGTNVKIAETLSSKTGAAKKAEKNVAAGKLELLKRKLAKIESAKAILNKSIVGLKKATEKKDEKKAGAGEAKEEKKEEKKDEKKDEKAKFFF